MIHFFCACVLWVIGLLVRSITTLIFSYNSVRYQTLGSSFLFHIHNTSFRFIPLFLIHRLERDGSFLLSFLSYLKYLQTSETERRQKQNPILRTLCYINGLVLESLYINVSKTWFKKTSKNYIQKSLRNTYFYLYFTPIFFSQKLHFLFLIFCHFSVHISAP